MRRLQDCVITMIQIELLADFEELGAELEQLIAELRGQVGSIAC